MLEDYKGRMPPGVMQQVMKSLKSLNLEEEIKDRETRLTVWDFAGQHIYYAWHCIFLTITAVYLLIYDMSKDLNAPAGSCLCQSSLGPPTENESNHTNLENLLSWINTVHCICQSVSRDSESGNVNESPYVSPPILIVGTHADSSYEDKEVMENLIKRSIQGKEFAKHVLRPFFRIENSSSDCTEVVQKIKDKIEEILQQESYIGKRFPLKWFHFEKVSHIILHVYLFLEAFPTSLNLTRLALASILGPF